MAHATRLVYPRRVVDRSGLRVIDRRLSLLCWVFKFSFISVSVKYLFSELYIVIGGSVARHALYGFFPEWVYDELRTPYARRAVIRYVMRRGYVLKKPRIVIRIIENIIRWRYPVYAGMWWDYAVLGHVVWPVTLSKRVDVVMAVAYSIADVMEVDMIPDNDVARMVRNAGRSGVFMFLDGSVARVRRPSAYDLKSRYLRLLAKLMVPRPLDSLGYVRETDVPLLKSGGFVEYWREGGRTWVAVRKERAMEVVDAVRMRFTRLLAILSDAIIDGYEIVRNERYVQRKYYMRLRSLVNIVRKLLRVLRKWLDVPLIVDREFAETVLEVGELFVEDPFMVTGFVYEAG